ncbi:MAG: Protein translocase subunit SecF [Parcubacteria group bacterium GW2011_GWA2_56_7]|nr:MAG: Protein translocase subunit SecF [Parcubacteria group bacterium GW2011_GWA2_56_7]
MISIVNNQKWWYGISGALVAASIVFLIVFRIPFGIDFTGGSLLEVQFETRPAVTDVRGYLNEAGYGDALVQETGVQDLLLRFGPLTETQHQDLLGQLQEKFGSVEELRFDSIGPVIGRELARKSVFGLLIALVMIVLYVAWAFRHVSEPVASWKYGVLTIVAGLHDLFIPLGVFALLGNSLHFQVDTAFIAALLTILGYSINDTIVVFDRTRENVIREGSSHFAEVVDKSIKQTFARSINTTVTTLLALFAIFFFGGETTRSFALALIIGITTGAYSSIFIASPLLVTWYKWQERRRG